MSQAQRQTICSTTERLEVVFLQFWMQVRCIGGQAFKTPVQAAASEVEISLATNRSNGRRAQLFYALQLALVSLLVLSCDGRVQLTLVEVVVSSSRSKQR